MYCYGQTSRRHRKSSFTNWRDDERDSDSSSDEDLTFSSAECDSSSCNNSDGEEDIWTQEDDTINNNTDGFHDSATITEAVANGESMQMENEDFSINDATDHRDRATNIDAAGKFNGQQSAHNESETSDNSSSVQDDITDAYVSIFMKDHHAESIDKDGNCLASTIAFFVYGDSKRHVDSRREVCDYLSEHEHIYSSFAKGDNDAKKTEPFVEFLVKARKEGRYLGQVFIKAAADFYGLDVVVLDKSFSKPKFLTHSCFDRKKAKKKVVLQYENNHYEPLVLSNIWQDSHAKQAVINAFNDMNSGIHTQSNAEAWETYGQHYDRSNTMANINRLRSQYKKKEGHFSTAAKMKSLGGGKKSKPHKEKECKVEQWYTQKKIKTKPYQLLFNLLMNSEKNGTKEMTAQQLHESSELFSQYPLRDFKQYVKNMRTLTDKTKLQIRNDTQIYKSHVSRNPRNKLTSRGQPFWDTHQANDLLAKDVKSGKASTMTPLILHSTRPEYQEFHLEVFRKHIYQENRKQEGQQYWLPKRNLIALKAHLAETQEDASKWEEDNLHYGIKKLSLKDMS